MRLIKIEIDLNKEPYITVKWRECRDNGAAVFIEDRSGRAQYKGLSGRNVQKSSLDAVRYRKPGCASLWYVDDGRGRIKGSEAFRMRVFRIIEFLREDMMRWACELEKIEEDYVDDQ